MKRVRALACAATVAILTTGCATLSESPLTSWMTSPTTV